MEGDVDVAIYDRVTQSTAMDKIQLQGSCQCKQLSFRLRSALPLSAVQTREDPYLNRKGQVPMMVRGKGNDVFHLR